MADVQGEASGGTSARPSRLRVMRSDVHEVFKSPRRNHPKKQKQPPPLPLPTPPPRKEKAKDKENKKEVERTRYNCAFRNEEERGRDLVPPDLVWGKIRSHPWWPGQVFDAADASEIAFQHRKAGAQLVAYFWDRTFAWSDESALLPFRANFTRLSAQSTMSAFTSAVDAALQEVGRRVEAGLSCGCFSSNIATKQEVHNSGIRQGAYGAAVDCAYMRDTLCGEAFLDYISALGKKPLAGTDALDLATAKAQLRAFNRSRGAGHLPEFVMFEGIEDAVEAILYTKRKRMYKSGDDDIPPIKEKKSRHAGSLSHSNETLKAAANEEAMDDENSGGVTENTSSKGKNSKHTKSSAKKKINTSKHSDGIETSAVKGKNSKHAKSLAKKKIDTSIHSVGIETVVVKGKSSKHTKSSAKKKMDTSKHSVGIETIAVKGKRSKHTKSSAKKKIDTSKHSDGIETVVVDDSRTSFNKTTGDVLSESKSGRMLRSMLKKEDALEGLRRLGKDYHGETSTVKGKDTPFLRENKMSRRSSFAHKKEGQITEDGYGLGDGSTKVSAPSGKRSSGHAEISISKRVPISEHGRKKKKLSDLMTETGSLNSASGHKSKPRGKRPSHESTEKDEDPDRDSKDTVKTRKRKKLNTLGDLSPQSQPLSRKESTKVRELMSKAAGSMSQTTPAVKENSAASQTKSHRAKLGPLNAARKSPRSVKVNQGKKDAFTEESLSCCEMLWQLSQAACNLKQREKMSRTSVNFFTDFRKNSNVSSSDVDEEIPKKVANTESTLLEQPIADHMRDDYWADILINVGEALSSLKKKKSESKKKTSKKAVKKLSDNSSVTLKNADEPRSESNQDTEIGEQLKAESKPFLANGSQLNTGTQSAEELENSLLSGLVLHFSRPSVVPSRSDLIKIFSQYGPVNEAKAEIATNANSAQVIFKRRMDAEAAFAGAGKISALGPALVSFRLMDFPAAASVSEPLHGASKSE